MKKIIAILTLTLTLLIVLAGSMPIFAATAMANLNSSSLTVKPGETFTVVLSVNCQEGINGVIGLTYNYDKDKLDLVSEKIGTNYTNLGTGDTIDLITNAKDKLTNEDIYIFEFKAKETIKSQTIANISTGDIKIDSDEASNSEAIVKGQKTSITIKPEGNTDSEEPRKETENPKEQEKEGGETEQETKETEQEKKETEQEKTETEQEKTETEKETKENEKNNDKKNDLTSQNTTRDKNNSNKKTAEDTTKSKSQLPKTGTQKIIIGAILILSIIATVAYVAYRKMKF